MIVYKDMAFCDISKDCPLNCERRLTDEMEQEAVKFGLPVCYFQPTCGRRANVEHDSY